MDSKRSIVSKVTSSHTPHGRFLHSSYSCRQSSEWVARSKRVIWEDWPFWCQLYHCKKHLGYFNHILVISVVCLLCMWHVTNFKGCFQFDSKCIVEKLLHFVRLGSSCRRPIHQHFWWGLVFLWSYASAPGGVSWLHGYGRNARNKAK